MPSSGMPTSRSADANDRLRKALLGGSWFAGLPTAVQDDILQQLVVRKLLAGETIYLQGAVPAGLFAILSGQFQTHGTAEDGQVKLLSVLREGEWTGFLGLFDRKPNPFTVSASVAGEVAFLPKRAVETIFADNIDLVRRLSDPLLSILRFAYGYLINTNGRSPRRVVAQRLLDLGHCLYTLDTPQALMLDAISQDDVADASYLTRPTVNRVLRAMVKQGAIKLGYGKIEILDVAKLVSLTSGRRSLQPPVLKGPAAAARTPWAELVPSPHYAVPPEDVLRGGGWFPHLPPEVQKEIVSALVIRRFKVGEAIYSTGDPSLGLYVLIDGQCRIIGHGVDNGKVLMGLCKPGEWTGFLPLVDGGTQPFTVTASRASTAALLPKAVVDRLFLHDAHHYHMLLSPAIAILRYTYEYLIETNQRSPVRLVAQRLYDLARSPYLPEIQPSSFVDNLTQDDIAMATGLSRPTVNRVFADLTKRGIVELGYGKISISDPLSLVALARDPEA